MRAVFVGPRQSLMWAGRDERRAASARAGGQARGGGVSCERLGLGGDWTCIAITHVAVSLMLTAAEAITAGAVPHDPIEAHPPSAAV